ncbi:MAG: hypothetical protein ISS46_00620 [Candidatus Omnitrophica bacterium]|nr:hypothetical protein [Candidatus Omnitrophota bacterium]
MEENIQKKPEEQKSPEPSLRPGGQGFTVSPVSPPPSPQPTTPLPKVFTPPPTMGPPPELVKEKKDAGTFFLLLIIIFSVISLVVLAAIGLDKIPDFLVRLF